MVTRPGEFEVTFATDSELKQPFDFPEIDVICNGLIERDVHHRSRVSLFVLICPYMSLCVLIPSGGVQYIRTNKDN